MDPTLPAAPAGDPGALGAFADTIRGGLASVEGLGNYLAERSSFTMSQAMIWAIIAFCFLAVCAPLLRSWSDAGARKWEDGQQGPRRSGGRRGRDTDDDELAEAKLEIERLRAQVALLTQIHAQALQPAQLQQQLQPAANGA